MTLMRLIFRLFNMQLISFYQLWSKVVIKIHIRMFLHNLRFLWLRFSERILLIKRFFYIFQRFLLFYNRGSLTISLYVF